MALRNRKEEIENTLSREYRVYKEEEFKASLPQTLYEKSCRTAAKILTIKPDKANEQKIQEAIDFAHLHVTPEQVSSFSILFLVCTVFPILVFMLIGTLTTLPGLSSGYGILGLLLSLFFTYYFYSYPFHLKKKYEMDVGSQIVTMILYMAMYMRNTPNLEGAIQFASENIGGSLGYELKKLMWDVEVGNYLSMEQGVMTYTKKWAKNREFLEAVELLITSMKQVGERRITLLDEAVRHVLEGNREQARHFNQELKLPVLVVNALGIILPVMGLVLFPIVAVFLGVDASVLFIGYDIILPFVLYFVIIRILEMRPATFSVIDVSENPDIPPNGCFFVGKQAVPALPVGIIIGGIVISIGLLMFSFDSEGLFASMLVIGGFAIGGAVHSQLIATRRIELREKTRKIETEFAEALFQLGNQISGGKPIELSIEMAMDRIKNLSIKDLFDRALRNMKFTGMTFEQSFFDKEEGAIRMYPSRMIKSIMHTVVESSKKGVETAAVVMVTVSQYLKDLHQTQEDVKESLNDTIGSLTFQLYFLSPLISGIITTLAIIIIRILAELSTKVSDLGSIGSVPFISQFGTVAITPFQFVLVVGIYLVETAFILSLFINALENGEDEIGRHATTASALVISFIVFAVTLLTSLAIFSPLITSIV
ncbi:MAG: hypothetical protein HY832_00035 [Candidatus Aenigmarchaeota archaeon]|nr:hypothetical protein [Candidatus Aenigmarchaeota archaeon]